MVPPDTVDKTQTWSSSDPSSVLIRSRKVNTPKLKEAARYPPPEKARPIFNEFFMIAIFVIYFNLDIQSFLC
jgi:hypothetical protein